MPPIAPLAVFLFAYTAIALGRLPGLALDRTGFAILGATAFLLLGEISLDQAREALDIPTLIVLFAMMLLSAQYHLSGLYGRICSWLTQRKSPRVLLLGTLLVSAALSAVLTNDVIAFSLTPLVGRAVLHRGLAPGPFLLAIALGTNFGSALTPIGNPQNILISQKLGLQLLPFLGYTLPPVLASLAVSYFVLQRGLKGSEGQKEAKRTPSRGSEDPSFDSWQATKALILTALTLVLFLSPIEAPLAALFIAGVILTSRRMHTRTVLALVDWHLLALFVGLFILTEGLDHSGWTSQFLIALEHVYGDLSHPVTLVPLISLLGVTIGNVPAVMLLLHLLPERAETGYIMALASTFVGNAVLIGSVANLIVAEQAGQLGIRFGFREHLRIGLPVTLASFLILGLYLWVRSF